MVEINTARYRLNYVCTCNGVSRKRIHSAIQEEGAKSVEDIRELTGACTVCQNCKPTIQEILDEYKKPGPSV